MYTYKKLTRKLDKRIKKMIRQNTGLGIYPCIIEKKHNSLEDLISGAFVWMSTKQKSIFWGEVSKMNHKKKTILGKNIFLDK